ncbi:siderophore-interacting protein [Brucella cytisi]|uniref:siderophore-interacting protein n=1 Tax=Brucella cytisi TaxID=407152 RepID=UPI0035E10A81
MTLRHTQNTDDNGALPRIERVRHEIKRRRLEVRFVETITPNMIRITLGGDELAGFNSLSAGDHIKIFVPDRAGKIVMRDYTPRSYDPENQTLVLDFAVHEAGPATQWAINARPGNQLEIGGPRGSELISGPIRAWLLIGDETALPSIGRRIEEMALGTPVTTLVAVAGPHDEQRFETLALLSPYWIHRDDATDASVIINRLREITIEPGTFIWLAAEGSVARATRAYLVDERKHPLTWLRASGYWVKGKADSTEKFDT